MTIQQTSLRDTVRSLTLSDIKDSIIDVAESFLAQWCGDSQAAKVSLVEMGVNGELAGMLGLAMDTVERRRQRALDRELGGCRIRRGRYRWAS